MKYLWLCFCFGFALHANGQYSKKTYQDQLEPDSELLGYGFNYTIERLPNGKCIYKKYYAETKMIIQYVTSKTDQLKVKSGLYYEKYDDGTLVSKGMYMDNAKQGEWIENIFDTGYYDNDIKVGEWKTFHGDSLLMSSKNYVNGELHGEYTHYDSLGVITSSGEYENGKLLNAEVDTVQHIVEEMPRFPGCENQGLSTKEVDQCAKKKLLLYIYGKLKYPKKARKQGAEGMARVQFVVDRTGEIIDIKVLHGITKEIKKTILKLIEAMPRWRPGTQRGKPVKVLYTLPINFKLT